MDPLTEFKIASPAALMLVALISPAVVFKVYKNERYHTTISYPSNWEEKKGLLSSDRTVVAFVDPSDIDTSISLAFNPIPADFTRLTSFGGKDNLRLVHLLHIYQLLPIL